MCRAISDESLWQLERSEDISTPTQEDEATMARGEHTWPSFADITL
jgi:hypothetical protein